LAEKMKDNKFKNISDHDLEVIINYQTHYPDYLEAAKEYVARQQIKNKKRDQRQNLNLYLTIFIFVLTLILFYFTIVIPFYKFPVPFIGSSQPKPNAEIHPPNKDQTKSKDQNMNQEITKPHKTPKDEPKKSSSQQITPPDRQKPGVR
jgi:hypothetical protein